MMIVHVTEPSVGRKMNAPHRGVSGTANQSDDVLALLFSVIRLLVSLLVSIPVLRSTVGDGPKRQLHGRV